MKTVVTALVAVAGLAAAANAQQVRSGLEVRVSTDNGDTWADKVNVLPGSTVLVAIFGRFENAYGLGGATFRMQSDNRADGDAMAFGAGTATGRAGVFNFGAATNAIFTEAGGFRLDAASDAANAGRNAGATFLQRSPSAAGVGFDQSNPAMAMLFVYTVSGADNALRTIDFWIDELKGANATAPGVVSVYTSSTSTSSFQNTNVWLEGAQINVVPTPGALALMGMGGLLAGRRRR
ncbi:MAG: hypothetical protein HRU70_09915 [Phycisphaeraceae bacterium]|nr:MAG: hypothetical protein HRU70_09915 [Phycisphaeraceae bacterium]